MNALRLDFISYALHIQEMQRVYVPEFAIKLRIARRKV